MQFLNCISNFVRRMRLELTRPCDHYPLKVACIPISPPAQGLFEKLSGKRDSNPRPQPWQGCALPTELFPHSLCKCEIFASLGIIKVKLCFCSRLSQKFRKIISCEIFASLGIKNFFSKSNFVCF